MALHREVIDHALHRGLDLVIVAGPLFAEAAPTESGVGLLVIEQIDVEAILEEREASAFDFAEDGVVYVYYVATVDEFQTEGVAASVEVTAR